MSKAEHNFCTVTKEMGGKLQQNKQLIQVCGKLLHTSDKLVTNVFLDVLASPELTQVIVSTAFDPLLYFQRFNFQIRQSISQTLLFKVLLGYRNVCWIFCSSKGPDQILMFNNPGINS